MIRKTLVWISIFCFMIILVAGYIMLRKTDIEVEDTLQAVPQDAAIIINVADADDNLFAVLRENEIWNDLTGFPAIKKLNDQLLALDSIIKSNRDVSELYKKQELTLSFHKTGRNRFEYIFYLPLLTSGNQKQLIHFVEEKSGGPEQISIRKYSGTEIFDVKTRGRGNVNFSFTFIHGLFILSQSGILVESAIRQLDLDSGIPDNPEFIQVAGTSGKNVKANIYINHQQFPVMIAQLFKDNYRKAVGDFLDYARWTEIDVSIRDDALLMNGFTCSESEGNDYLNILTNQSPQKIDIEKVVPGQVAALVVFGMADFRKFKQRYNKFMEIRGSSRDYLSEIEFVNKQYDIDIEETFYSFIEKEAAVVVTDIKNYDWNQNTFFVLKTVSRSVAEDKLVDLLNKVAGIEGIDYNTLVKEEKIDNDVRIKIYTMPIESLAKKLLGNIFSGIRNQYCTFYDNYLIFGNSVSALTKYVHANLLQNNLGTDLEFNQFSDYLASRSNLYVYLDISRSVDLMQRYLKDDFTGSLEEHKQQIRKIQAFAFQLTTEGDLYYNNIFLKYTPEVIKEPQTVWESRLENPIDSKPKFVVNHYTQQKEIFFQDKKNIIYLLNNSGRILWKQQLESPILSDVYQIDFHRNGKLQMLFNTRDYIYLLDRNGNNVEKYPLKLRSPASNGLALFDYESNKDYRILVATEDKSIYAYNKEGDIIKGWEFGKTDYPLINPLQHFRIDGNDCIVAADLYRIYILDRKGRTRVAVKDHFPVSGHNNLFFDTNVKGLKSRLAITDTTGHVHFIYFDGSSEEIIIRDFSSGHNFYYSDIDGNGRKESIFTDGNELTVYTEDKKQLFSRQFKSEITHPPLIYQFSARDFKTGIVLQKQGEIYLVNNNGSIYKGFPLRGSTQFSIGSFTQSTGKFNLVVGSDHNFLYNYYVQ